MASTIKPIEAKSVHQIQSGQVIVDLCSAVKELVENALDAEASSIEVRFKNNGLDAIEVQDNGTGISEANYENLALKHYTSKLSTYEDLLAVQTFGFRGEALSSLCALSDFSVVTAQAHEAPKGKRLEFELSGKLKSTSLTAAQKGTTVTVENLFARLPVRQRELSKNIKREYGKVLGVLQAYACISTNVKFTVKNAMPKGRSSVAFSTKGNSVARDNIANVYGAKMLSQLTELQLKLDFEPVTKQTSANSAGSADVIVSGHISKPVFGEGRQTPDRQMFFVNGRPCGLPQIAKAINEVYKSYNVSQSPFIFADFRMDTAAYDVNVSPDKRTILLHNAGTLIEHLKTALIELFDETEQTVPQSQLQSIKLPSFQPLTPLRKSPTRSDEPVRCSPAAHLTNTDTPLTKLDGGSDENEPDKGRSNGDVHGSLPGAHFGNIANTREEVEPNKGLPSSAQVHQGIQRQGEKRKNVMEMLGQAQVSINEFDNVSEPGPNDLSESSSAEPEPLNIPVRDFNARMNEQKGNSESNSDKPTFSRPVTNRQLREQEVGVVPSAMDRMRPRRTSPEVATITIGDKVITRMIGTPRNERWGQSKSAENKPSTQFSQRIQKFDLHNEGRTLYVEDDVGSDVGQDDSDREESTGPRSHQDGLDASPGQDSIAQDAFGDEGTVETIEQADGEDVRSQEERRVAELIRFAEDAGAVNNKERQRRATQAMKGSVPRDSIVNQVAIVDINLELLARQAVRSKSIDKQDQEAKRARIVNADSVSGSEEERLSLTISKSDFGSMHIVGQFNLGFIIAVRQRDEADVARSKDEVFIIDQHASDEKYNFERLQLETVVGNQRLVHPTMLDLTAVEEEIVLENEAALQQNGFIIETDDSGELPVGQRCRLVSLPLSKEVVFNIKDLEELIHLLSDSHISAGSAYIPRPSKVRKMFAMRACRSSIMIGKTLSRRQMRNVLDHMGRLDKPWNCPHGRPTMRHLTSLDNLDGLLWNEGNGVISDGIDSNSRRPLDADVWKAYAA